MLNVHEVMTPLFLLLAAGAVIMTCYMWRGARRYYNLHVWYKLAMATQASIAITALIAVVTETYWLALFPATLFLFLSLKGKAASDQLIDAELNKIKSLYNDKK